VIPVACEPPSQRDLPLSRHFASSGHELLCAEGGTMSRRTVQRILGLYEGVWQGQRLGPRDHMVCADETPSIQARSRAVVPPAPGRPGLVESDYQRRGALQYLCAWDVRRGRPWGRCEAKTGIAAFTRLVDQVMARAPYRSARRVSWIVDNGSAHRGERAVQRLQQRHPRCILVHTPVHASWLNQQEIYFGIVQRKGLTPAAAPDVTHLATRIPALEARARLTPAPFRWRFTRADFRRSLAQVAA